jgi:hypothetical protein
MIVSKKFPEDSWEVATAQHEVYYEALEIIVKKCNQYAIFARRVIQSELFQSWGSIYRYDHRTLQHQHDLLATVWRYRTQASQLRLDCDEDERSVQIRWLDWLTAEVDSWIERPDWVRFVQIILENQNTPLGQRTETLMSLQIMDYFLDIPWDSKVKNSFERAVNK